MPRVSKNTAKLEAVKHLMGELPDHKVAEEAGVTASAVGRYRRKHGIAAYEGYKFGVRDQEGSESANSDGAEASGEGEGAETEGEGGGRRGRGKDRKLRKSKLSPFFDELGKVPDREVADKAGVSVEAVRMYRRRHDIPLLARASRKGTGTGRPRRRTSKLDPYREQLGKVPDREIAEQAGVTSENVRSYRRRHGIVATWRASEPRAEVLPEAAPEGVSAPERVETNGRHPASNGAGAALLQGFSVTVQAGEQAVAYIIIEADIATAAARAVDLIGERHPGGAVVGIKHLGSSLT